MVKGLELFREHFRNFRDRYVLIGGTACDLAMSAVGLEFRATKDLDIVLCVEALDAEFGKAFWAFVRAGQYQVREMATGEKRFYRFKKPVKADYPAMLELFSRVPDALVIAEGSNLTPIPVDDAISSLSAILLDNDYYHWIHSGRREVNGVSIVGPEHLIPLKAKAWLDLRARKAAQQNVDSGDISKHRNDIFRLFRVIDPEFKAERPLAIVNDMCSFCDQVEAEGADLKHFNLGSMSLADILQTLRNIYVAV